MRRHLPTIAVGAVLIALLILAGVFMVSAWNRTTTQISIHGWIALTLGVVLSIILGAGLMALMFYSNRSGHDEAVHREQGDKLP
jgi:predicted transporter